MIRKINKLIEGNVYFDNDDIVFTVLEKYLSPRDASWLQRNKQGLCKGDKVIIGEHILGLIAHEYAIRKFGPYVANNVGSVASYFSVMKPLTIDIKTGRVTLPQCYLAASNLSRELKKQYNQLKWQLDEVFRDIAEEILVILDEDPIERGEEIPYEYESIRRNRYRGLCTESSTAEDNKMFGLKNKAEVYDWYTMYYGKNKRYFEKWFETARKSGAIKQCDTRLVPFKYFLNTDKILGVIEYDGTPFGSKENNYD